MGLKRIDGHRHIVCPEAVAAASKLDPVKSVNIYPVDSSDKSEAVNRERGPEWNRKMTDFDENLADLKAAGLDLGVLQPTQTMFFYWADSSAAAELTRMVNEYTAQGVRKHPDHFLGLATVPLQDVELAVSELTYAVETLKLKGVVTGSNVNGQGFDEPQFRPFFERVQALDIPIFIHPNNPAGGARVKQYYLINYLAYPLESAITTAQMAFGGVFDRYPGLKICLSHAGGVLPFLLGRLEHGQAARPESREFCAHPFSYYLKNVHVDTITFRPDTLRFVLEIMPEGHVFTGTDYPYDMSDPDPVGSVEKAVSDQALRNRILGENISRVLGIS